MLPPVVLPVVEGRRDVALARRVIPEDQQPDEEDEAGEHARERKKAPEAVDGVLHGSAIFCACRPCPLRGKTGGVAADPAQSVVSVL